MKLAAMSAVLIAGANGATTATPVRGAAPAKAASPAKGASPSGNRDVHCLLLANMYAKVAAADRGKVAAGQARLFYLGRISGRLSNAQLGAAMAAEAKRIDPARTGDEMDRCAATVQATAATVESVGSKVRAEVVTPAGPPAPAAGAPSLGH